MSKKTTNKKEDAEIGKTVQYIGEFLKGEKASKPKTEGDVYKSIEKTLKYIVYMKASSFVLTRILNTVLKSKEKQKQKSFVVIVANRVSEWREYLTWLESLLETFYAFGDSKKFLDPSLKGKMKEIITITKNIRIVLRRTELLLTFVVLTRSITGTAISLTAKRLGLKSSIIWLGALYFLHVQFQSLYPLVERHTKDLVSLVKSIIYENWEILMEDLEENNPELYNTIVDKLKNFDKFSILPGFLINGALQVYQMKENAQSVIQPYLEDKIIPIVQIALIKAYTKYLRAMKKVKKLQLTDPMTMTMFSQDPSWAYEFLSNVANFFSWNKKGNVKSKL